jgi:hypothetical protein
MDPFAIDNCTGAFSSALMFEKPLFAHDLTPGVFADIVILEGRV